MGAQYQEWFCLDVSRQLPNGEYPVLMFDARDNALDQQFYDDFGQMLRRGHGLRRRQPRTAARLTARLGDGLRERCRDPHLYGWRIRQRWFRDAERAA